MDLVERSAALEMLRAAVADAAGGAGAVVSVTGEAGIGKTSLLRALVAGLPRDVAVLAGACDDLLTARPLGPLRDAARGVGGPLESALLAGRTEDVFGALVAEVRRQGPVVLIVDDLQWADDASLDVLAYLVRRVDALPAAVVLSFRDDRANRDHPLYALLAAASGARVQRLALAPLSAGAVARMAEGSGWDGQQLLAVTGGNPFFVSELLAAPRSAEVPETVAETVVARVRRLDQRCRAALEQLSVVPRLVEFALAEALLGDALVSLAQAEECGILQVRAGGIAFRHELARRAVQGSVPRLRRRVLHAAVVRALLDRPDPDVARVVHHGAQAGDGQVVCQYAPQAGRESAASGSHRQALAHFEAALRFADRLPAADRARLLDEYAWELYNAHRIEEAVAAGEDAVRCFERIGAPVPLGEALGRLSRHHVMLGAVDEALRVAGRAIEVLASAGSPAATAAALTSRASLLALGGDPAAVPELTSAERLAVAAHRPDLVCLCRNYQSIARPDLDPDGRIELVRHSLQTALRHGFHEVAARGYTNLVELLYRHSRFAQLRETLTEGLAYTADRGFRSHAYNLQVHRGLLLMRTGDWQGAQDALRAVVEQDDVRGVMQVYSLPSLTRLRMRTGAADVGQTLIQAWRSAREHRFLSGLAFAATALAEWAFLTDRRDVAERIRREWLRHAAGRPGAEPITAELLRYCARTGVLVPLESDLPMPWTAGIAGDWRAAADAWAAAGDPYEQALELAESGRSAETLQALGILDQLGATVAARLVRRRLKQLGMRAVPRGPQPQTRANPASLTRRQLDVLALLAADLTNAQIAAELVLSVRTVDHHVSGVLTKLGVSSRAAAKHAARGIGVLHAAPPAPQAARHTRIG